MRYLNTVGGRAAAARATVALRNLVALIRSGKGTDAAYERLIEDAIEFAVEAAVKEMQNAAERAVKKHVERHHKEG